MSQPGLIEGAEFCLNRCCVLVIASFHFITVSLVLRELNVILVLSGSTRSKLAYFVATVFPYLNRPRRIFRNLQEPRPLTAYSTSLGSEHMITISATKSDLLPPLPPPSGKTWKKSRQIQLGTPGSYGSRPLVEAVG